MWWKRRRRRVSGRSSSLEARSSITSRSPKPTKQASRWCLRASATSDTDFLAERVWLVFRGEEAQAGESAGDRRRWPGARHRMEDRPKPSGDRSDLPKRQSRNGKNCKMRPRAQRGDRSEEHTSELQSRENLVC